MTQFNLPRKPVLTVQLWASVVLLILAFIFSMTPLISLDNTENEDQINYIYGYLGVESVVQEYVDESIDVTAFELIGNFSTIMNILGADVEDDAEVKSERVQAITENLDTEDGKEAVGRSIGVSAAIIGVIANLETSGSIVAIIMIFIGFISLLTILVLTIILPIIFGVMAIKALIAALKNIKTPEEGAPLVAKKLTGMISLPLIYMLFQNVISGVSYASGTVAIFVLAIIATVVNLSATRVREYPDVQFTYLNIVQASSIVSIIGFAIFFFNILNVNVYKTFTSGTYGAFVDMIAKLKEAGVSDLPTDYIVDGALVLVYMILVLIATSCLDTAVQRLSGNVTRGRYSHRAADNGIVLSVIALATTILPNYLSKVEHGYEPLNATETFSFLVLSDTQSKALMLALFGAIIMILADVAVIVLKKVFCPKLTAEEADALLVGTAKTSKEKLEEAKKLVAEAEANGADAEKK